MIDHLKERGHSARQARQLLQTGKVRLRGVPVADGGREIDPDAVVIDVNAPRIRVGAEPVILFRDAHLAVLWKPSGMLSVAAPRRGEDDNLISWTARTLRGDAHPVHRLDEGTSGLLVVARTAPIRAALIDLFQTHGIDRRYLAIVAQTFPEQPKTIHSVLIRDRGDGKRGSARPGREPEDGQPSTTHVHRVEVLRRDASVVQARLETGRTHQVRIHLSEAGFPVLGEPLYAKRRIQNRAPRLALHAWRLKFDHPHTGETLRFEAPLADDLERLRRDLNAPPEHTERPARGRSGKKRRRR